MIDIPNRKPHFLQEKFQKPIFFFKNVDLTMDGFKFEDFEEFQVKDTIPATMHKLQNFVNAAYMNEYYIVIVGQQRNNIKIIFRKNLKCHGSGNSLQEPIPFKRKDFSSRREKTFYQFLKLIEVERVRIAFNSLVKKVLLNADQVIIQFESCVFIYTPLSTCTIDAKSIDIAFNFYFYILTENQILIYNEKLHKTIDISRKCDFIVPTAAHIFLIRDSFIYKIIDDEAILYFDTLHFIKDVVFDDTHMYLSTPFSIIKLGLHVRTHESIAIKVFSPCLRMMDDFVILHDYNNGIGMFLKKDLQKFNLRSLNWDLTGIAAFKNEIAYLGSKELHLIKYKFLNGDLVAADYEEKTDNCVWPRHTYIKSPEQVKDLINSQEGPDPYDYYGVTFRNRRQKFYKKFLSFKSKYLPNTDDDDFDEIFNVGDNQDFNLFATEHNLDLNSKKDFVVKEEAPNFNTPDLHENKKDKIAEDVNLKSRLKDCQEVSEGNKFFDTPPLTAPSQDFYKTTGKSFERATLSDQHQDVSGNQKTNGSFDEDEHNIEDYLKNENIFASESTSTEGSEDGLFFDDEDYIKSTQPGDNEFLNAVRKRQKPSAEHNVKLLGTRTPFYTAFSLIKKPINNPLTYYKPLETFNKKIKRVVRFSDKGQTYETSSFFCKSHFKFFKKRFKQRDSTELETKHQVYDFISEEFKKIVGYRTDKNKSQDKKIDLSKRMKGGF